MNPPRQEKKSFSASRPKNAALEFGMISDKAIIYPGVVLGENCTVEDFVILGALPRGSKPGELQTIIGNNATIRSHTVIYAGNKIGHNFQTGNKVNIRELNTIGDDVSVGTLSVIEHHIQIGNRVRIHTQAFIPEYTVLEDECWIGPNVVLTNAKYPLSINVKNELKGPVIKKKAIIGANSTLLPGITIGANAIVGAGSVVTKDVPENCVFAGNPAKLINRIDKLPYKI
jgi:acetyltransferase-like isoleucine patch superfamily enzyme